jgi:hypothetical protein
VRHGPIVVVVALAFLVGVPACRVWDQGQRAEAGRPAGGRYPFRLRSGAADRSAHTTDDVTHEAFWSPARPAR